MKKILLVPDLHSPFEDKRAWRTLLKAGQVLKPDIVVVLGDFVDCASISSHSKDLSRLPRFKSEIKAANKRLDELESLGATDNHFIEGNHEFRLDRYLRDRAPELSDMLDIRELLGLDERRWKFTPYRSFTQIGKLYITHEAGKAGSTAHSSALSTFQDNVVIGHTHRLAVTYSGNAKGKTHVGAMLGWLGDKSKVDYMHKVQANRDWQLGFGVGYMETSGVVHLQAVPIVDYRCVVEGQLICG